MESLLPGYDRVRRRISPQLHSGDYPESDIVPFTSIVHDRVSLEVARGCTRGCRFCQAGYIYRPVRERSSEAVIDMAEKALSATGYEDLSLLSLSTGDYSAVEDLVRDLMVRCKPKRVALSLPSMRVGGLSEDLMRMIKEVRKTGITIAPEAGTERLRKVVNKDIEEDEIVETAKLVFEQGWLSLKLYFMIGLPTETEEDIDGIVKLCDRIRRELGFSGKSRKKFTVSVSTFVPKPHTPFQWASQLSPDKTRERLDRLRNELKRRKIQMKWQDPRLSLLEGAFSRGDRRLADVLLKARELGCRFDGWSDQFDFEKWVEAFEKCGLPLEDYAGRAWSTDEVLPWSRIDTGVSGEYLKKEYELAMSGERTPDCRNAACLGCGVCDHEEIRMDLIDTRQGKLTFPGMDAYKGHVAQGQDIHRKFRVKYEKTGPARFLGHLELGNVVIRAVRRSGIPIRFSQGYHPMPKIDLGPALPLGVESLEEYIDFESFGFINAGDIKETLKKEFPQGLNVLDCEEIPVNAPSIFKSEAHVTYRIRMDEGVTMDASELEEKIAAFHRSSTFVIRRIRKDKVQEKDVKPDILQLETEKENVLMLKVSAGPNSGFRLLDFLSTLLGWELNLVRRLRIQKTRIRFIEEQGTENVDLRELMKTNQG